MTTRTITAMQVIAVMNSYMLPHGTRCSEMPRVRMPVTWAARPMQVSVNASRTQNPAGGQAARRARRADRRVRGRGSGRRAHEFRNPGPHGGSGYGGPAPEGEVTRVGEHCERVEDDRGQQQNVTDVGQSRVDRH